jgi:hypothetical protein
VVALGKRAVSGKRFVEHSVRLLEALLRDPLGRDAVVALDLVLIGDLLAGQLARRGLEHGELCLQPGAVRVVADPRGVLGQSRRLTRLLGLDALRDLRGSVVGVDEIVEMLAETKRELEVLLGGLAHERSKRAAWPWPTPTQSVARP